MCSWLRWAHRWASGRTGGEGSHAISPGHTYSFFCTSATLKPRRCTGAMQRVNGPTVRRCRSQSESQARWQSQYRWLEWRLELDWPIADSGHHKIYQLHLLHFSFLHHRGARNHGFCFLHPTFPLHLKFTHFIDSSNMSKPLLYARNFLIFGGEMVKSSTILSASSQFLCCLLWGASSHM